MTRVTDEVAYRADQWRRILDAGGPEGVKPSFLRTIGVYGGAQGIWQDNARTHPLTADKTGATVAVLHTGRHYPDDLSAEAIIYHYPTTTRQGRDAAEIAATKHAAELQLPVFVITPDPRDSRRRSVHRAYVESWDDEAQTFRIVFELSSPRPVHAPSRPERSSKPGHGAGYRVANESHTRGDLAPFAVDPNLVDRGTQAHARTQNALAAWCRSRGLEPTSPGVGQPDYDVAWFAGETLFVAEVKSLTPANETRQIRLGLGQVLDYRQLLHGAAPTVRAVLALERAPSDDRWATLCEVLGVTLVWPSTFDSLDQ